MTLDFIHKPNYFLFSQLLIRHLQQNLPTDGSNIIRIPFARLQEIFQDDTASVTTNLQGILNIADEYKIDTLSGDQAIIQNYQIDSAQKELNITLNTDAIASLKDSKSPLEPDATSYQ
ncbi:MAG: hypothetical protein QM666_07780 [Acinetobacter sp.]